MTHPDVPKADIDSKDRSMRDSSEAQKDILTEAGLATAGISDFVRSSCPLCGECDSVAFHGDSKRHYLRCRCCRLVYVPSGYFLTEADEKRYYDLHQNDPGDVGYRRFLSRLARPLADKLQIGACGLDFGCGPGPTLSVMMEEAGFAMDIFDPIYASSKDVWNKRYDFVTASEVVEHLQRPMPELQRVWEVLRPGGWLGIMTKRVIDANAFARWHYKDDPTHVAFFSIETFEWLRSYWAAELEVVGDDVVLLRKATDDKPCDRADRSAIDSSEFEPA
jgi:hypothetical protein